MLIGLVTFELHLPHARSLKEKRKVVKGLVESIHHRCRVSVMESGHHDLRQRAEISVAMLARSESDIDRMLEGIRRLVDARDEALVGTWNERVLESMP